MGVIGLAVMGESLALNLESKGYRVSVYNRTVEGRKEQTVDRFMREHGQGKRISGYNTIAGFVASLQHPRKILLMIRAGRPVDETIQQLMPYLSPGDILIDGGNSNYTDTERRVGQAEKNHFYFVGAGISGGQEGALHGASIMPGGSEKAWPQIKDILQSIAARTEDGQPCCEWIGKGGAGHFIKMVHNGIEYADMQIIAEAYYIMRRMLNAGNPGIVAHFEAWNQGKLKSYLIEITADILRHKDAGNGFLIDRILDVTGQKGTGRWAVINGMELDTPLNLIATAVFERDISAFKELRLKAARLYNTNQPIFTHKPGVMIPEIHDALYASKLIAYAQGFQLMQLASTRFNWELNLPAIARIWRAGCIIRATLLTPVSAILEKNPDLQNLLLSSYYQQQLTEALPAWKSLIIKTTREGIGTPAFSSALHYFYSLTAAQLPANLIQAQRDYFGAHTFERTDRSRGEFFHENWTGNNTHSGIYNA